MINPNDLAHAREQSEQYFREVHSLRSDLARVTAARDMLLRNATRDAEYIAELRAERDALKHDIAWHYRDELRRIEESMEKQEAIMAKYHEPSVLVSVLRAFSERDWPEEIDGGSVLNALDEIIRDAERREASDE